MPRRDGTGPFGQGAASGRGLGPCGRGGTNARGSRAGREKTNKRSAGFGKASKNRIAGRGFAQGVKRRNSK